MVPPTFLNVYHKYFSGISRKMGCDGCEHTAKALNQKLSDIINKAKIKAVEEGKSKAVCYDQVGGYFVEDAQQAIATGQLICEIVSYLR